LNRQEAFQFLKSNPVFWSQLGFGYDPPMKNQQGKPLVFTEDLERYARTHRMFAAAGVQIHDNGFVKVAEYCNGELRTIGNRIPNWLFELQNYLKL